MSTILGANTLSSGYDVANSARFNVNTGLNKTAVNGTQTKATFSAWVKRSIIGDESLLFYSRIDASNHFLIRFTGGDALELVNRVSASNITFYTTNALYRDVSAWYHVLWIVDTTLGTAGDRIKLFVNGTRVTDFGTSTTQNQNTNLSANINTAEYYVAQEYTSEDNYFDGYLTEVVYLDGVAASSTDFGEFDEDSPTIWKPIDVSGLTFGNSGFYLDFEISDTLGNDANGGTDFSNNNLVATDQSTDTCTNNFATMNPLAKGSDITMSEGNLKVENGNSDNSVLGTIGLANGKFYWEAKCTGATTYANIGITLASADGTTHSTVDAGRIVYSHNGYVYKEGLSGQSNVSGLATFGTNDIVSVAYDGENGSVKFYKNGTLVNTTTDNDLLFSNNEYITSVGINQGGFELNFGSPPYSISSGNADARGHGNFEYAVPSGYFALCSKNLAEFG